MKIDRASLPFALVGVMGALLVTAPATGVRAGPPGSGPGQGVRGGSPVDGKTGTERVDARNRGDNRPAGHTAYRGHARPPSLPPAIRDLRRGTFRLPAGARRRTASERSGTEPTRLSAEDAAKLIEPGDSVYVPIGHSVAKSVLKKLTERASEENGYSADNPVEIVGLTDVASPKLYEPDTIVPRSLFLGANNRDAVAEGKGGFVPTHLSHVPRLIRSGTVEVDTAVIKVSPPDKNGYVSLGPSTATTLAALEAADTVIAEVNPNVPRTHGAARIHKHRIDAMVESNDSVTTLDRAPMREADQKIAEHVMKLIPENPHLQFGIGSTTDAIAQKLAESGRDDLRIHSEMISDGTMDLVEAGAVREKVRYSFALGSQEMLNWMDDNRKLEARPTDFTNDPRRLSRLDKLISINTALRVDLNGQANAQYVGGRFYSGVGGQQDFFRGAMRSDGGKAILALHSASKVRNEEGEKELTSNIVFKLGEDDVVTTSMHDVQYVVTEHGVAKLEGKSARERAEALIQVAHPEFRGELRQKLERQLEQRAQKVQRKRERRRQANNQDGD